MTNWTLETMEDFEGVFFDDGTGWKVLFEIHLAIQVRVKVLGQTPAITALNTKIPSIIWTDDDTFNVSGDLRTELNFCYQEIEHLLSGVDTLRWTEAEGRSPEWTLETLTADIGMGDFQDLLIRTQSPAPLVWLIAAINRLQYPKIRRTLYMQQLIDSRGSGGTVHRDMLADEVNTREHTVTPETPEQIWDGMFYDTGTTLFYSVYHKAIATPISLGWTISSQILSSRYDATARELIGDLSLAQKLVAGTYFPDDAHVYKQPISIKCIDYPYQITAIGYTGPDLSVEIGSSGVVNIGKINGTTGVLESADPDLDFAGSSTISFAITTTRPTSVPFTTPTFLSQIRHITVTLGLPWIYCTLPEIMGAGELTAPEPTIGGAASQEE